jgi:excisionase family DNA binding protein
VDQEPVSGDESYLLPSEAAEELGGVTAKTIGRWAKEGKLPYLRTLGGHRRYPATAIRELAATLSHEPEPDDDADPDMNGDTYPTTSGLSEASDTPLFPSSPDP